MSLADIQRRLFELGWDPGPSDGIWGPRTERALSGALDYIRPQRVPLFHTVPLSWMPSAEMKRVILHWTAGAYIANGLDRKHYHILVEGDGQLCRGIPTIDLNDARGLKPGYAAHTARCNSGAVGVSICAMMQAKEVPFDAGPCPLLESQWRKAVQVVADVCRRYGIPVDPRTVLSHAEVEGTLGIKQRGKWDVARLAFDLDIIGARAIGDRFRAEVKALL
jgi:hypothetical protein